MRVAVLCLVVGCASSGGGTVQPISLGDGKADGASYDASAAVTYADSHWDDGQGLCAEFTSRSLRAGSISMPVIIYVPTLVEAFANLRYDEYAAGDAPTARAGDVVVFSDASGDAFCPEDDSDEYNCGHACPVTVGGSSEDAIELDCHNNAHYHIALGDLLGGGYSTYRVYHLAPSAPPGTVACTTDADCNGGDAGTQDVCAASEGYCIHACHSDFDCPSGTSCTPTQPHWSCQ